MDMKKIKDGIDAFEDDRFSDADETFREQIRDRKNEFLKDELGLKNDIETKEK